MQIISGITEFELNMHCAVAIGKFDGIHKGHRLLIDKIKEVSKERFLKSVVFTFNPSPESFFCGHALPELTTVSEKRHMFEKMGIDILIEFPMNAETAATAPTEFIQKYLCDQMRAKYIVAGSDISFGDKGKGNADLLMAMADECEYQCELVDKITYDGTDISSTRIRERVKNGEMHSAADMLGSPYTISGVISHGRRLGTQLSMPTANVYIAPDKLVPPRGVYFTNVILGGVAYPAVSNVGVKPTVAEDELLCGESCIYDFDEDVYGRHISVELLEYSRPEMKFENVDALKNQMQQDLSNGRKYHGI